MSLIFFNNSGYGQLTMISAADKLAINFSWHIMQIKGLLHICRHEYCC